MSDTIIFRYVLTPGGGYFHQNRTWMCLPDLENLTFSIYQFLPNFPPISIPFSKEKHPLLTKLGAFYNNLPKIHPIYVIWAPSSLVNPHRYTKFREKAPQKAGTYTFTMSMWDPPPGSHQTHAQSWHKPKLWYKPMRDESCRPNTFWYGELILTLIRISSCPKYQKT